MFVLLLKSISVKSYFAYTRFNTAHCVHSEEVVRMRALKLQQDMEYQASLEADRAKVNIFIYDDVKQKV